MHNDFTLFSRKFPSGKKFIYYYAYDGEGRRLGPWATGQTTKTAARNYCNLLIKKGTLLPVLNTIPTFADYAALFWDWEKSPYLNERKKRRELTQHYADKNKKVTDNTLVPYFGKYKLDAISADIVDLWLDKMIKEGYKNTTTNGYFGTLQTMVKWAVKKRIIERDPFLEVQKLVNQKSVKRIITLTEFKALFTDDWAAVWDNDIILCTAHKVAALTGMRSSEVLGLRGEFVFDTHIYLCGQYDEYGYRATKTKIEHHIPIAAEVVNDLMTLKKVNGDGFLFSLDGGATPVSRTFLFNGMKKAFEKIGISDEEMKKRGLNIHAWRHFANTELQVGGLSVKQVQAVIGHKTLQQTERYTHFDPMKFGDVAKIQAEMLKPTVKNEDEPENEKPVLKLVKAEKAEKPLRKTKAS